VRRIGSTIVAFHDGRKLRTRVTMSRQLLSLRQVAAVANVGAAKRETTSLPMPSAIGMAPTV
jgi:hypothetical protein